MRKVVAIWLGLGVLGLTLELNRCALAHESERPESGDTSVGTKLETLMSAVLEGVEGTEVIVSRVTLPPHTTLPKHWHPGEEFVYVLDGSVVLWREGQEDVVAKKGDAVRVALKQVHTAMTGEEGASALVFRVHEQGKPERVLVD